MERFELGNDQYLELKYGKIVFHCRYEVKTLVSWKNSEVDGEKLKEWLERALKPRYKVVHGGDFIDVIDNGRNGLVIAQYLIHDDGDAELEAERFCKQLNEQVGMTDE